MQTEHMKVDGMSCGGCTTNVTNALKTMAGVKDVTVSLSAGEATVQYDEQLISPGQLKAAVQDAGYGVKASDGHQAKASKGCCCH